MISKFFHQSKGLWPTLQGLGIVAIASFTVTGGIYAANYFFGLQWLELPIYDRLVRWRSDPHPDPRLLVVEINEPDIRRLGTPLSDHLIAQTLAQLQKYQPKVIGLDIFRDIPIKEGYRELARQFAQPNVIGIRQIDKVKGVPAPKSLSPKQVGFNDITLDSDGTVRRNLIFAWNEEGIHYSFALRQALLYLKAQGITPNPSKINPKYMQLGKAVFFPLEGNVGVYQKNETGGYQIILNYRAGKNIAKRVSVTDVLNGKVPPELVHDKIVLIGTTALSVRDIFFTPYSAAEEENPRMAGVLVHAQMVSQILSTVLDGRPLIWFWPKWGEWVWILGWSMIGGTLGWKCRHPLILGLSASTILAGLGLISFEIFQQSGWIPVGTPVITYLATGAFGVVYQAYENQRKQKIVMRLLGQNTSPEIAKALWNSRDRLLHSGKLPGQKLTATMMFTDLKDFSTISELMPPEKLMEWLNELLSVLSTEVTRYQGIINKFTGDGVMAVFGVPVARTSPAEIASDAQRACLCALAMSDRLVELNRDWQERGLPVIQMRIGIYTGPIVAGSLGGKERLEYGVIGDSVNIASRLESCEKDRQPSICRILIGHDTFIHIQEQFLLESWGPLALKGKQQMVEVYRIIAQKVQADPEVKTSGENTRRKK